MREFLRLRSMLFVPAHKRRRWERASGHGSDGLILDLEDGVGPADKPAARAMLAEAVAFLAGAGACVTVRINATWLLAFQDIAAAMLPGVRALIVPKVEEPGRLAALSQIVAEFAAERGLAPVALLAMIESPAGLERAFDIAAVAGVCGLALGVEDYSASLEMEPTPDSLDFPCRRVALAARARGVAAFGAPMSIMAIEDAQAFGDAARRAQAMGMTGVFCADPRQVSAVNAAFDPSAEAIASAREIVAAWEAAGVGGVVRLGVRIIDEPVVARARSILAQVDESRR